MMRQRTIEGWVGFFMIVGIMALLVLALKVSGLSSFGHNNTYQVIASFDNIGGLKERAPVKISGVKIGEVSKISLQNNNYRAKVVMAIDKEVKIPDQSTAAIYTAGLLGSQYINVGPVPSDHNLPEDNSDKARITNTTSAMILENLISQFFAKASTK